MMKTKLFLIVFLFSVSFVNPVLADVSSDSIEYRDL